MKPGVEPRGSAAVIPPLAGAAAADLLAVIARSVHGGARPGVTVVGIAAAGVSVWLQAAKEDRPGADGPVGDAGAVWVTGAVFWTVTGWHLVMQAVLLLAAGWLALARAHHVSRHPAAIEAPQRPAAAGAVPHDAGLAILRLQPCRHLNRFPAMRDGMSFPAWGCSPPAARGGSAPRSTTR